MGLISPLSLRELPVELFSMSGIHPALKHFSGSCVKKNVAPQAPVSCWWCLELLFCCLKFFLLPLDFTSAVLGLLCNLWSELCLLLQK